MPLLGAMLLAARRVQDPAATSKDGAAILGCLPVTYATHNTIAGVDEVRRAASQLVVRTDRPIELHTDPLVGRVAKCGRAEESDSRQQKTIAGTQSDALSNPKATAGATVPSHRNQSGREPTLVLLLYCVACRACAPGCVVCRSRLYCTRFVTYTWPLTGSRVCYVPPTITYYSFRVCPLLERVTCGTFSV